MARYDRIAQRPPPARADTFAGWPVLRDLDEPDASPELDRRVRLRFLVLRIAHRLLDRSAAGVPWESWFRQIDAVEAELGTLPGDDRERARLARFLRIARQRSPRALAAAAADIGALAETLGHEHAAAEYRATAAALRDAGGGP